MNDPPTGPAPLRIGMDARYDRLQMIPWWDQQRLARARIMVVGAGALGNEVIKNLALVGAGLVVIVDFDTVEATNLSRSVLFREADCGRPKAETAAAAARELNPGCDVRAIVGRIPEATGAGLLAAMDLVIGCVDNREARLWINRLCWRTGRPWVDGGIQEISGVAKVFAPPGHPAHVEGRGCYECTMTDQDYRLIQLRYSCPLLAREEILQGRVPTAPTIASIIAGLQVQEALKLLHGLPSASGAGLVFNGVANHFYQTAWPVRDDCLSHEAAGTPVPWRGTAAGTSAADLIRHAGGAAVEENGVAGTVEQTRLQLDHDFVVSLHCGRCARVDPVEKPVFALRSADARCPECGGDRRPEMIHEISAEHGLARRPLASLGVPPMDWVRVRRADGTTAWFSLEGDRPQWLAAVSDPDESP